MTESERAPMSLRATTRDVNLLLAENASKA
jgi:hypothetical protein